MCIWRNSGYYSEGQARHIFPILSSITPAYLLITILDYAYALQRIEYFDLCKCWR